MLLVVLIVTSRCGGRDGVAAGPEGNACPKDHASSCAHQHQNARSSRNRFPGYVHWYLSLHLLKGQLVASGLADPPPGALLP